MSIFKEHKTISSDRSASDRARHKDKIQKAIKDGLKDLVADESIIGKSGKTRYRVPVRGIKEYRFVYGNNPNNKQTGSAPGKNVQKGQKIGEDPSEQQGQGDKAGSDKGEEYYDVEISLEELAAYLFQDLQLPDLERKQLTNIESSKIKRSGYRPDGIMPRLDRKKSAINRIKRMKASGFDPDNEDGYTFPFHEEDLKFRHYKVSKEPCTNAVIFFIMDVSGSMSQDKKFLSRSFFFLMYQFLRTKYNTIDIVFISHDVEAREVDEESFFSQSTTGGTLASTALSLTNEIIEKRYQPSSWNIYTFQASDGDNFEEDTSKFVTELEKLIDVVQLYGYCEIEPYSGYMEGGYTNIHKTLLPYLHDKNVNMGKINGKEDVWKAFKQILGGDDK